MKAIVTIELNQMPHRLFVRAANGIGSRDRFVEEYPDASELTRREAIKVAERVDGSTQLDEWATKNGINRAEIRVCVWTNYGMANESRMEIA